MVGLGNRRVDLFHNEQPAVDHQALAGVRAAELELSVEVGIVINVALEVAFGRAAEDPQG